jgi:uncharacterized protein (TIGR02145 family)
MKSKPKSRIPTAILVVSSLFLATNCTTVDDATLPVLTTTEVTEITQTTATSGGVISFDGGTAITERGICWSETQPPEITDNKTNDGSGTGSYTSAIAGLKANTTYYIRAYATNSNGTGYGSVKSFTTLEEDNGNIVFNPDITYGTVTDIDGNTYKTVTLGTQTWMAENLKTTKYNDGTAIPNVTDATAWGALITGAYCNYDNDQSNVNTYGQLYNWYAVNTGKLCPAGWHVSSDAEWTTLINYLGGETAAGHKLRETGILHWDSPNEGATNLSGFTALPGGQRDGGGSFYMIGVNGLWWTATNYSSNNNWAWFWYMDSASSNIHRAPVHKKLGNCVRCVKN